ncbi:LOW QUALITY PROTEIN: hypothetical protein BC937DRAFT_88184 [Endogone sp. FLAS-F59071]|nr:LOW QUALITY PROTEIN: hypothetical protein BC937DRAFT_88184 [Endogone sp. FLAS-F59071]|eukprot:RUS22637.1 LOW QUALITY PROTEIN: hypothetical protein BC937DRAFT_88184 [Endogone sp. FLAS-F59071]
MSHSHQNNVIHLATPTIPKIESRKRRDNSPRTVGNLGSSHPSLGDEPGELALGQKRVDKVQAREIPDVDAAEAQSLKHPIILWIAVAVLVSSECVRHTLDTVHYWTRKILTQCGDEARENTFPAKTTPSAHVTHEVSCEFHLLEPLQILFNAQVAVSGRHAIHALYTHRGLVCVIHVGLARLDELQGVLVELRKVVGCVRHLIRVYADQCQVLLNRLFELGLWQNNKSLLLEFEKGDGDDSRSIEYLFLAWIGVVKPDDQLAAVRLRKVMVQQGGLGVTNMQVAAGLWREASDDLAILGAGEVDIELALVRCLGLCAQRKGMNR